MFIREEYHFRPTHPGGDRGHWLVWTWCTIPAGMMREDIITKNAQPSAGYYCIDVRIEYQ